MTGLTIAGLVLALWGWLCWRGRRWPSPTGPEQWRAQTRQSGGWQT